VVEGAAVRRAIISDIHANLPALEAILADVAAQGVTSVFCLGDVIGYGPSPRECLERSRGFDLNLLGNHEEAVLFDPVGFNTRARAAVEWTRDQLSLPDRPREENVALWDLFGKETGLPVHTLMGGAARTTIPLYWSTGSGWQMQPEEMLDLVKQGWDMGFRAFKIRMDWKGWRQDSDPAKDYAMFKLVREYLSEGNYLGFDANNGYSVSTAIQQGRKFEALEDLPQRLESFILCASQYAKEDR